VRLQRQLRAGVDHDPLHLEAAAEAEGLVPAPGAVEAREVLGLALVLLLEGGDGLLHPLGLADVGDDHCVLHGDRHHVLEPDAHQLGQLEIAVAGLGPIGGDAEGDDAAGLGGLGPDLDGGAEGLVVAGHVVGGGDEHQRVRLLLQRDGGGEHGGGGVAQRRLDQDLGGVAPHLAQLLGDDEAELGVGQQHRRRVARAGDLRRDRHDRLPARTVPVLVLKNHAQSTLAHFWGELVRRLAHRAPSYSGVGASGRPGAVQAATKQNSKCKCNYSTSAMISNRPRLGSRKTFFTAKRD